MNDPIQRLTKLLQPFITEGCFSIQVIVNATEQTAEVNVFIRSDGETDDLTQVSLPEEVVTDLFNGCHELRRHLWLMGSSTSVFGLEISADGRNSVWAESNAVEPSAESQEATELSSPPTGGA